MKRALTLGLVLIATAASSADIAVERQVSLAQMPQRILAAL